MKQEDVMEATSITKHRWFMRSVSAVSVIALLGLILMIGVPDRAAASDPPLVLTTISTAFNGMIGIDHHEPTGKVLVSVNYPTGNPHNLELVAPDGTHAQFSALSLQTDELKVATVRTSACMGGFLAGQAFTGNGTDGEIVRISPDGLTVNNPWVSLPGAGNGLLRGSLFQDRYCAFGGDLIAVTTAGEVWRINSDGVTMSMLVDLNVHLEGVTTVPNNPSVYGPWSGKILAGAEGVGCIYAIDGLGNATCHVLGVDPEDFDIIPAGENFYGVNYPTAIVGAPAAAFAGMVGDILVTQEFPGQLYRVFWNGVSFEVHPLLNPPLNQWEHVTFSPAGIVEIGGFDVTKRWSFTNVCFELDNDDDGLISEDPVNFDPTTGAPIDDDGDGLSNEDPSECPAGTSLGQNLPAGVGADYRIQAVVKKDGTVSSYNPGQMYAVSTVQVLGALTGLRITEDYSGCTGADGFLALNPAPGKGGGSVVVVVEVGGVAVQVLDANSPEVAKTDDEAVITLGPQAAGAVIHVYVKFKPGLKGTTFAPDSCINHNIAQRLDDAGNPVGAPIDATASLEVVAKF
jgi:hypothetical protein